jgi:hypothetical protein
MPEFGQDFRTQILVGLKAEGLGAADKLRDEIARLQRQLAQLYTDMGTGNKLWWDFREAFGPLNRELGDAARRLRELEAAEAAQVAEQAALISSAGAWGAVLRQSGANMATYARQIEEESGKATQKQIADAERATAAVQKASDAINAALAKEEAASERATMKQAADADRLTAAVRKASDEINALLAKDPSLAGFTKMNEAIRGIEQQERNFVGWHTRAYAGINREQEHLNDLLAEGLQYENSTVTLVDKTARAYKAKTFEVEKAADGITRYTAVTDAGARASKGGASAMDEGTKSTKQFGLGILNISHAIQDAQYGFGAVVNNIALVTQSLGGGPGLAGTAMVVGVAVSVLSNNIKGLAQSVGALEDPTVKAAVTLADLKEKIKEVEEKPHKIDVDYQAIEAARKEVDALEKKLAAFKAIGDQTTTQEKVGKAVSEAIKEHAGGTDELSGKENLEKLMIAAAGPQFQEEAIRTSKSKKAEQIREAQSRLEALRAMKPADLYEAQAIGIQINDTIESIARLRHDLTDIVKEKVDSVIGGAARGIDADRARIAELFDRNEKLFTEGDKARGILPVEPMFRGALEVASAANVKARKKFEEENKHNIERSKEQLKQAKEREDLDEKLTAMGKQADDALIAQHAAAFGAKKALGGLIEAKTRELVGKGEKDPERLRAAARAIAEADIRESKFVPEEIVPAVAVKVAEPHTERAVAELIAGAAPGQDIVAAAKAGAAAGEAKAEKPEITREAARVGREANEAIHDSILAWASENFSAAEIRKRMIGPMTRKMKEAGVKPELAPDVATKLFDEALGKVRAELVGRGGVNAETARAELGERQIKAIGQEQGRERRVERVQGGAARPAVARQIFAEFGGNVSPEQATVGAEKYQQLLSRGENPMIAAQKVMADMFGVLQENLNTMGAMTGMFEQFQGMVAMARQRQQAIESVIARLEGKLKSQRWVKPAPWGTIPGG